MLRRNSLCGDSPFLSTHLSRCLKSTKHGVETDREKHIILGQTDYWVRNDDLSIAVEIYLDTLVLADLPLSAAGEGFKHVVASRIRGDTSGTVWKVV